MDKIVDIENADTKCPCMSCRVKTNKLFTLHYYRGGQTVFMCEDCMKKISEQIEENLKK